ncbi:unnamed protein product [Ceutorhynchus assimilis]|uniref:Dehydrogenase E1 component domain-containing protein n=1 Tax=Ceutorhynchus assimilis TaxID=467358 RepID=A0A9N9QFK4_9CUCU|nr:unnamed protein product [Ceutorhynchus assimilis]
MCKKSPKVKNSRADGATRLDSGAGRLDSGAGPIRNPTFMLHKLTKAPATQVTLTRDEALEMYTQMHTIRRMETAAANLYKEKNIRGFCHLYSGQEAVAVGFKQALRPQDSVITAYRAHGWTYVMGVKPLAVMAELTGRQTGTREEVQEVQEVCQTRDPITFTKEKIISSNLVTAEEIKKIDAQIKTDIDTATEQAKRDKEIGLDELSADITANHLGSDIRGVSIFAPLKHKRIGPANNLK